MIIPTRLRSNSTQRISALLFICIFGIGGIITLLISHAGSPTASFEIESGTPNGCLQTTADVSASSGSAIQFGRCNSSSPLSLDSTGQTIPDTNYTVPSGAIFMSPSGSDGNDGTQAAPVKTLNQAIGLVPSNGTIVARAGTYRDWYNNGAGSYKITNKPFTLQAYPHEQVWFDGSDVIATNAWTSDGNGHWSMNWDTPSFCDGQYYEFPYNNQSRPGNTTGASGRTYSTNGGPCVHADQYGNSDANFPAAGDPQMVFVNGSPMPEVSQLAQATGGKFFYDWNAKRIYISTNPAGKTVELAARSNVLVLGGTGGYAIKGVGFRRYATNEYTNITSGAIYIGGTGSDLIEKSVFAYNAGNGLAYTATQNSKIVSSVFAYNGHDGASTYGHNGKGMTDNFQLTGSVFNRNNNEQFGLNCTLSCAAAAIKMGFVDTYLIKNNIFENTQGKAAGAWCDTNCVHGVFVNNLTRNNGGAGYFYEEDTDGIVAGNLSVGDNTGVSLGAATTKVYNNTYVDCALICIRLFDDSRSLTTTGMRIGNNIVAGNSVNSTWFGGGAGSGQSDPEDWFDYFDYNSYWRPSSFTLYRMIGAADRNWKSSSSYTATFPQWEAHAQDIVGGSDPFFVDNSTGDYTVRTNSAAYHSGGTIPADVAAALGVSTAAGQTRGAFTWPGKN